MGRISGVKDFKLPVFLNKTNLYESVEDQGLLDGPCEGVDD